MFRIHNYFAFGISVGLLYPEANESALRHLSAFTKTAVLDGYETLETFLSDDASVRKTEISIAREEGKCINYNFPVDFQLGGRFDPGSADPKVRRSAVDLAKRHIDYAAQANSKVIGMTSGVDHGQDQRPAAMSYFHEYMTEIAEYALKEGITLTLEPVERGVFKNLLLGPTEEICAFVQMMKDQGHSNVAVLFDTAHMPLMGEDPVKSVRLAHKAGIGHVHIGNAIVGNAANPLYGHTHPPIGIVDGEYDFLQVSAFLGELVRLGYLSTEPVVSSERKHISLEMTPYPGLGAQLSAKVAYEKVERAWRLVLEG